MPRPIHFVLDRTDSYQAIQSQLLDLIDPHLRPVHLELPGVQELRGRDLSRFARVDVSVHPRNRRDHTPTGASMPRSDIVVADFGTTVYEAWALGKPVIFPRWLLADRIAEHMPNSAESLIFAERIGYHPDSFDELVDILRAGPVLTPDVQAFMADYLAPEYFGTSGARVAQVLTEIAARES